MTLLVKAAADFGLDAPFFTYYGASSGVATQLGEKGVDRLYQINEYYGDFEDPEMAQRQVDLYKKANWDFYYLRLSNMLDMLKKAADQEKSVNPVVIAKALEGDDADQHHWRAGDACGRSPDPVAHVYLGDG